LSTSGLEASRSAESLVTLVWVLSCYACNARR